MLGEVPARSESFYGIKNFGSLFSILRSEECSCRRILEDEPASELLKKIAAERSKLTKQGKLKKQKKLTAMLNPPSRSPSAQGWEWIRLGNALDYGVSDKAEAKMLTEDTWVRSWQTLRSTSKLLKKVRFRERILGSDKPIQRISRHRGKLRPSERV